MASIGVTANTSGAEVLVDDVLVGKIPLSQNIPVNPGRRKISLRRDGRELTSKVVALAGSEFVNVDLTVFEQKAASPGEVRPSSSVAATAPENGTSGVVAAVPPSVEPRQRKAFPTLAWVVTGILGAGTLVTGLAALSTSASLSSERDRSGVDPTRLDELSTRTNTLAIVADVLGGATFVSAGVSAYLTLGRGDATSPSALIPRTLTLSGTF